LAQKKRDLHRKSVERVRVGMVCRAGAG